MKKIKIGILAGSDVNKFYTNGLLQNAWALASMLSHNNNFEITMISKDKVKPASVLGVPVQAHCMQSILDKDLIICVAYSLSSNEINKLKKNNKKYILVHYGNCLMGDLYIYAKYNQGLSAEGSSVEWVRSIYKNPPDKVFYSPHFENQKDYFAVCSNSDISNLDVAPYIWDKRFIINSLKTMDKKKKVSMKYLSDDPKSKALIFAEPSINPIKTNLIPTIIANEVYKKDKNAFDSAYSLGSRLMISNPSYEKIQTKLKTIDLCSSGKFKLEGRIPMPKVIRDVGRVLVSHQVLNPLNYTYFEFALFGYPFVHNSEMLSEYGYYYEGNKILEGRDQLIRALNHGELTSKELEIYKNRCEDMMWKHSPLNKKNIYRYIELVTSAL